MFRGTNLTSLCWYFNCFLKDSVSFDSVDSDSRHVFQRWEQSCTSISYSYISRLYISSISIFSYLDVSYLSLTLYISLPTYLYLISLTTPQYPGPKLPTSKDSITCNSLTRVSVPVKSIWALNCNLSTYQAEKKGRRGHRPSRRCCAQRPRAQMRRVRARLDVLVYANLL